MGELYSFQIIPDNLATEEQAAKGKRYRLYREENGKQVPVTKFEDQDEMLEAMSREEYSTDGVYRATVQDLIKNSVGVAGVDPSIAPSINQGQVNFVEAARLEALRAHAAEMHKKLGSSDPKEKWEAIQFVMSPENAEAIAQAQEVYGAPQGQATDDMFRPGPLAHRAQLESGSENAA